MRMTEFQWRHLPKKLRYPIRHPRSRRHHRIRRTEKDLVSGQPRPRTQLSQNEQRPVIPRVIHRMKRQNIPSVRQQRQKARHINRLCTKRIRSGPLHQRFAVKPGLSRRVTPRHLRAIQVRNEPVLISHLQCQTRQGIHTTHRERHAHQATGILRPHRPPQISRHHSSASPVCSNR